MLIEIGDLYQSSFDILIINDGSDQELYFSKKNKSLKIINALKNNYKKFCRIDSDGEHHPKYIKNIFKMLDLNDFIIGDRKILFKQNYFKIASKKMINFIINKPFDLKIDDYNCGMMGLKVNAMKKIKNDYFINYPEPQIILKLLKNKLKYSIIKINQRKRFSGNSSINFFGGLDFFLITLFFVLNRILNNSYD